MTQTTTTCAAEHEPAKERIVAAAPLMGYPTLPAHIHHAPRLAVRLAARPPGAPLLRALTEDVRALRGQVEADHGARVQAIERDYRAGDMTPNQRAVALTSADRERATRLQRIADQTADLQPEALVERAKSAAQEAMAASWHATLAAWHGQHAAR